MDWQEVANGEMSSIQGYGHGQVMVRELPFDVYRNVCMKLNPESGLNNNFRILAGLMKYSTDQIKTFAQKEDPTDCLLQDWGTQKESTVGKLIEYLKKMNRYDVIDVLNGKDKKPYGVPVIKKEPPDTRPMALVRDIEYLKMQEVCQKLNLPRGAIGGDFEDFASRVGMSSDQRKEISRKGNPTEEILMWWGAKNEATVERMKTIMLQMGREDISNML